MFLKRLSRINKIKILEFKDGSMKVDLFTASAITQVYDAKSILQTRRRWTNLLTVKKQTL